MFATLLYILRILAFHPACFPCFLCFSKCCLSHVFVTMSVLCFCVFLSFAFYVRVNRFSDIRHTVLLLIICFSD